MEEDTSIEVSTEYHHVAEAWSLLHNQYVTVGFIQPNATGLFYFPQYLGSHSVTLCERYRGKCIRTISVVKDSVQGFPLDEIFPEEINRLRLRGRRLCEMGLFARDLSSSKINSSMAIQSAGLGFSYSEGCTDMVAGVHPKSLEMYQHSFGFEQISKVKKYPCLNNAPVVLIHRKAYGHSPPVAEQVIREFSKSLRFEPRYSFDDFQTQTAALKRSIETWKIN